MKQPIYVVKREHVIHWANHQFKMGKKPWGSEWGILESGKELIDAINHLKREPNDYIQLTRLAQCIQSFYTTKMPANANRMLIRLWGLIRMEKEVLTNESRNAYTDFRDFIGNHHSYRMSLHMKG